MAVTATQDNGDYICRFASGTYSDTASNPASIKLGFKPRYFAWIDTSNADADVKAEWFDGMADGAKLIQANTGATSYSATLGFSWSASTSTLTVDASLVEAAGVYCWKALG